MRGLWHLTRAYLEPGYADSEHYQYSEEREIAACAAVDHVVTLSPGLKAWLVGHGVAASRISVVGNASQPAPDPASTAEKQCALRARLGIPVDGPVLGYLGSLVAYEGLDSLLRAHARSPATRRPHLLIVGSGSHERALKRLARDLGAADRVVFAGRIGSADVPLHYAAMDAVILPRRDDLLTRLVPAIKPFEALAHRRPLIVSPALALALGETLPSGYAVLDLDSVDDLGATIEHAAALARDLPVPSWDDRAATLAKLYAHIGAAPPGR